MIKGFEVLSSFDTQIKNIELFFKKKFKCKNLQSYVNKIEKNFLLENSYNYLKSEDFIILYDDLISAIKKKLGYDFYYQKFPSIRIQKPGDKAVTFHIDYWSGHGYKIQNYWFSLTNLNNHNSLWVVDKENTKSLNDFLLKKKPDLDTFEKKASKLAEPVVTNVGKLIKFSNINLHGTRKNSSDNTRFSLDFRILKLDEDPGLKDVKKFYNCTKKIKSKKKLKDAISIIYCKNELKHISHDSQRSIIDDYCKKNKLNVYMENNEMLYVDHYPVTSQHLQKSKKPIVFVSKKILPKNKIVRKKLDNLIKKYKHGIHFALENQKI